MNCECNYVSITEIFSSIKLITYFKELEILKPMHAMIRCHDDDEILIESF